MPLILRRLIPLPVALLAAFAAPSLPAHAAATLLVPSQYPSIQAAINAASPGDTIVVSPGTYYESIDFAGKAITVESSAGPAATFIDGSGTSRVAAFTHGEGLASTLEGFTLQHGFAAGSNGYDGAGIEILSSSPSIANDIIASNVACGDGAGIYVSFGSPAITGDTITSNSKEPGCSGQSGGGLYIGGSGNAQVTNDTIASNSTDFGGGVALNAAGSPYFANDRIYGNTALYDGGGLYAVNQSDANASQLLLYANTASQQGGGIWWLTPSGTRGPQLSSSTLASNFAPQGQDLWAGGFASQSAYWDDIFSASTQAVWCDATYSPAGPFFSHSDAWASNANSGGFTGSCAGALPNGNYSSDPQFAAPSSNDFHLQAASAAIDAGSSAAPGLLPADLDGNPRTEGRAIDLGAYEHPAPTASLSPSPLAFGSVPGGTSSTRALNLSNPGNAPLQVASASLSGSPQFSVASDTCTGATVAPGASCTITVRFAAAAPGQYTASVAFSDNAWDSPQQVAVSATAVAARAAFNHSSLAFPATKVGRASASLSVTVGNTGNAPLAFSSILISGADPRDFKLTANTCSGASVSPGGSCTVSVAFTPQATGARTASLVFASNDPASPTALPLAGSGRH